MVRPLWQLVLEDPSNLTCDECFALMECYAEVLAGGGTTILPQVLNHLKRCPYCAAQHREALRRLIASLSDGDMSPLPGLVGSNGSEANGYNGPSPYAGGENRGREAMGKLLGLIVNPVAGMGGSVGLKGTDGAMYQKALAMGAEPVTPNRTRDLLTHIEHMHDVSLLVAPGEMGERHVEGFGVPFEVIGATGLETSAEDTKGIAREMVDRGIELLIFVGGDGTARDICDAIGSSVPVVAVPAGVKVFSAAFAVSARAAAEMVDAFLEGTDVVEEEVLDIDEEAFREDRLASRLYGVLLVPEVRQFLQPGKASSSVGKTAVQSKQEIATYVVEGMDPETLYLLGPGTTLKAIADELGVAKTLLGVDAVHAGVLVGKDLNERGILDSLQRHTKSKIVVTPIGGNGFILGRGSKQFTPEVIREVGTNNIMVVGTRDKVSQLECLRVDSGDPEIDEMFRGYVRVTVGHGEAMLMEVRA
jgi:predicted polyphosphate/ATP-dependent NAD kinase